ncbi:MAG TPA: hypothetical protein ENI23_15045 [bacterium]|nr:hypothetical protein [bacterium]
MSAQMKHISFEAVEGFERITIFDKDQEHRDVANGLTHIYESVLDFKILGAGQVGIEGGRLQCFGGSSRLGIECRKDKDTELLQRNLNDV